MPSWKIFIRCILENMDAVSENFDVAMRKIMPIRSNHNAILFLFLETRRNVSSIRIFHPFSVVFVLTKIFTLLLFTFNNNYGIISRVEIFLGHSEQLYN